MRFRREAENYNPASTHVRYRQLGDWCVAYCECECDPGSNGGRRIVWTLKEKTFIFCVHSRRRTGRSSLAHSATAIFTRRVIDR